MKAHAVWSRKDKRAFRALKIPDSLFEGWEEDLEAFVGRVAEFRDLAKVTGGWIIQLADDVFAAWSKELFEECFEVLDRTCPECFGKKHVGTCMMYGV